VEMMLEVTNVIEVVGLSSGWVFGGTLCVEVELVGVSVGI
jgi:hypothetical protein